MIDYENKKKSFEFEKFICFENYQIWKSEACGLFSSAQVLFEFSQLQDREIYGQEKKLNTLFSADIADRIYWFHRIIRMLWGYGFENILKGIIIKKMKIESDIRSVPINKIKTHNLIYLFNEAGFSLNKDQTFFIKIVQKCSEWMGRYPLPANAEKMYEQRKGMNSNAELHERSKIMFEKLLKGEIDRMECEADILHSVIGFNEYNIIHELISLTKNKIDE